MARRSGEAAPRDLKHETEEFVRHFAGPAIGLYQQLALAQEARGDKLFAVA
jgi:hypothetical protein